MADHAEIDLNPKDSASALSSRMVYDYKKYVANPKRGQGTLLTNWSKLAIIILLLVILLVALIILVVIIVNRPATPQTGKYNMNRFLKLFSRTVPCELISKLVIGMPS